jgi:activator of HSP90 ATPase
MSKEINSAPRVNLPTRRQVIAGTTLALGGLAASVAVRGQAQQPEMKETQSTGAEGALTFLHQEIAFKVEPRRIYEVLLDSKQFAAFSGIPAEIDPKAGGAFSMFGGRILGRNVELLPNQRIVQAWRPASWDPGVYSMVKFELKPEGAGATTVILDHTGFPLGDFGHLNSGWYARYWDPLKKFLS